MALYLSPIANDQQMDTNGDPLVGGKIYTYLAGSTTPVATYTDSTGGTAQANPIILNSLGVPLSPIWLTGGVAYKFVIKTSADVTLRTIDGITGINDVSSTAQEWNESGFVPTYISATQFSVPGDQTSILQVNRRLRNRVTAGYAYGRISVSSFAASITTVTVVNDSTPLDSGLSSVAYGFLSYSPSSVPFALYAEAGDNITITKLGNNTSTIYTTAGTSTAYTITPTPVIAAYAVGQSFVVNFNAASGAAPTLQISGIATPPNLVRFVGDGSYRNIAANEIPANHRSRVTLISTTQALVEELPSVFSMVRLNTANGYGSTNNRYRRFTNVVTNQGTDITYADSSTLGASFTVNVTCMVAVSFSDQYNTAEKVQISLNDTAPTAIPNVGELLADAQTTGAGAASSCAWTGYVTAGSVIRARSELGNPSGADTKACQFTIARVG